MIQSYAQDLDDARRISMLERWVHQKHQEMTRKAMAGSDKAKNKLARVYRLNKRALNDLQDEAEK